MGNPVGDCSGSCIVGGEFLLAAEFTGGSAQTGMHVRRRACAPALATAGALARYEAALALAAAVMAHLPDPAIRVQAFNDRQGVRISGCRVG